MESIRNPKSQGPSSKGRTARIEDIAAPIVGAYYFVPTVYSMRWDVRVPIYGPLHEDREFINFEEEHWHVDWRFVSQVFYERKLCTRKEGSEAFLHGVVTSRNTAGGDGLEVRRLRMKRLMPPYPPAAKVPWLNKLEQAFAERTLPKCRTCPHRGISLRNVKPDENGQVVCTGHGLAWNVRTGALVRRTTDVDSQLVTGHWSQVTSETRRQSAAATT